VERRRLAADVAGYSRLMNVLLLSRIFRASSCAHHMTLTTQDARVISAFARSCVVLALLAFCVPGSSAQGSVSKLRVATRVVPPMVIEDKGALRGFSIELWNSISARLNRETEYLVMSDVGELLDAVVDGRADLGIAAISITSEREIRFDFSQPILNAGLQILVRGAAGNAEPSPVQLMRLFFSRTLIWLGIAFLMIMIPAHLVWVVERHHRNGIIPSRNYFPGIFHAMFWAAGTLATQADHMPRHWMARIVAVLWMFTAVVFVAFYTAQLTASLTAQQIRGSINGPQDLVGRHVGTTRASTAAAYLSENKARCRSRPTSRVVGIDVVSVQGRAASASPSFAPDYQAIFVEQ
jgi:polar amino acid transport system substrate-binding protein